MGGHGFHESCRDLSSLRVLAPLSEVVGHGRVLVLAGLLKLRHGTVVGLEASLHQRHLDEHRVLGLRHPLLLALKAREVLLLRHTPPEGHVL